MAQFTGQLQGSDLEPTRVLIEIADNRFRVMAGRRPVGSWPLSAVNTQRTSIYKFALDINGDYFDFYPDDPSAFSDEVGAVIDLTESKGRFGLRQRIERAASS